LKTLIRRSNKIIEEIEGVIAENQDAKRSTANVTSLASHVLTIASVTGV